MKKITRQSEAVGDDLIFLAQTRALALCQQGLVSTCSCGLNRGCPHVPSDFSVIPIDPMVHQIIIKRHQPAISQALSCIEAGRWQVVSIPPPRMNHLRSCFHPNPRERGGEHAHMHTLTHPTMINCPTKDKRYRRYRCLEL